MQQSRRNGKGKGKKGKAQGKGKVKKARLAGSNQWLVQLYLIYVPSMKFCKVGFAVVAEEAVRTRDLAGQVRILFFVCLSCQLH